MPHVRFSAPIVPGLVRVEYLSPGKDAPSKKVPAGYVNLLGDEVFSLPFTEDGFKDATTILKGAKKNHYFVKAAHIHPRSAFCKTGLVALSSFTDFGVCPEMFRRPDVCIAFCFIADEQQTNARWKKWQTTYSHPAADAAVQPWRRPAAFVQTAAGGVYVPFTESPFGIILDGLNFADSGMDVFPDAFCQAEDNALSTVISKLVVTDVGKAQEWLPSIPVKLTRGMRLGSPDVGIVGIECPPGLILPASQHRAYADGRPVVTFITSDPLTKKWTFHVPLAELTPEFVALIGSDIIGYFSHSTKFWVRVLLRTPLRPPHPSRWREQEPNHDTTGLVRYDRIGDRPRPATRFCLYDWDNERPSDMMYYHRRDVESTPPKYHPIMQGRVLHFKANTEIPAAIRAETDNLGWHEMGHFIDYFLRRSDGGRTLAELAKSVGLPSRYIKAWAVKTKDIIVTCEARKDIAKTPPLYSYPSDEADLFFLKLIAKSNPEANIGAWLMNEEIVRNLENSIIDETMPEVLGTWAIANHFQISDADAQDWLLSAWRASSHSSLCLPLLWPASILTAPPHTALMLKVLLGDTSKFVVQLMKDERRLQKVMIEMMVSD